MPAGQLTWVGKLFLSLMCASGIALAVSGFERAPGWAFLIGSLCLYGIGALWIADRVHAGIRQCWGAVVAVGTFLRKALTIGLVAVLAVAGIALVAVLGIWAWNSAGTLPTSGAIIVGALIIAGAIHSRSN